MRYLIACLMFVAAPVWATETDEAEDAFVEANLISIFYHELGHALIDILKLPVFGQEEDAADVAAVLLIDAFFEEEAASGIVYDTAFGFLGEAEQTGDDIAWWDTHGPDEQRFYTLVCLFYGADPEGREDIAEELGLPEERAEMCPDEFDLANDSWGPIWEELQDSSAKGQLVFEGEAKGQSGPLIKKEAEALNRDFRLPQDIAVRVESCGEPNAFYDLGDRSITMCTEFEAHLREIFGRLPE